MTKLACGCSKADTVKGSLPKCSEALRLWRQMAIAHECRNAEEYKKYKDLLDSHYKGGGE